MAGGPFIIGDWRNLDIDTMTNLFLYGDKQTPPEVFGRIRAANTPPTSVQLDQQSFMDTGPGRYAKASMAPFVRNFFGFFNGLSGTLPTALQNLQGSYTVAQLESQFGIDKHVFEFAFEQRNIDINSPDYIMRTYIYNSESF